MNDERSPVGSGGWGSGGGCVRVNSFDWAAAVTCAACKWDEDSVSIPSSSFISDHWAAKESL